MAEVSIRDGRVTVRVMRHGWWAPTPLPDPSGVCYHEAPACLPACTCLGSIPPTEPQVSGLCRHEEHFPFILTSSSASFLRYENQAGLKLTRHGLASAPKLLG